jgi:hypothetical protein
MLEGFSLPSAISTCLLGIISLGKEGWERRGIGMVWCDMAFTLLMAHLHRVDEDNMLCSRTEN